MMQADVREEVLAHLRAIGVDFSFHTHLPACTMEECLGLPFAEDDVTFCKNILLCNRQETAFYLYVTLPDRAFRTSEVSRALHSSRLSFAREEYLETLLHLHTGSLTPLGLWFDEERRVQLALDGGILKRARIAFHPCRNDATVIFRTEDFIGKVVPSLGREPVII